MIAVDTNILIYAHRAEMPKHEVARARLRDLAEGEALWGVPLFCLAEFVRVVTHPKIFNPPSDLTAALEAVDLVLAPPTVRLLIPSERYPAFLRTAAEDADARGNLAFDAQIAAVCVERGATTLLTADRDFARFTALTMEAL